jgi:hypothetical protein
MQQSGGLAKLANGLLSELKSYTVPEIENVIGKTNLTVGYWSDCIIHVRPNSGLRPYRKP